MKKYLMLIIAILPFTIVNAEKIESNDKKIVIYQACTSEENIWVKNGNETIRIKLLTYDKDDGYLNDEIDTFICDTLKNANKIEIEYDNAKKDKYNREQVYIYVDDTSLNELLISKGYGQVNNVDGEYKYTDSLCRVQKEAIINHLGIWKYTNIKEKYCQSNIDMLSNDENNNDNNQDDHQINNSILKKMVFISSGILILLLCFRSSYEKR